MTTPEQDAGWFAKVADVFAKIDGIYRVFGVKGADGDPKVMPMSTELPTGSVIGILGYDAGAIIPGSWERQTHTLAAAIWIPLDATGMDKAYTLAVAYIDRVMAVFPANGKAGADDSTIQSVLVTTFETIEGRVIGERQAERQYVVLPFSLEVVRALARRYAPE